MSESLDLGLQEIWLDCDRVSLMCSECGDKIGLFQEYGEMNLSNLVHAAISHRREAHSMYNIFKLPNGQRIVNIHSQEACHGRNCVIHNPLEGPWREWALHYRSDRNIFERICPHGVGHPDPSQFDYWTETEQDYQSVHGCCGECACGPRKVEQSAESSS